MGVGRDVGLHYTGSIVITIEFDGRHHASVKKVTDTKTEVSEWWLTSIVSLTDRNQRAWPRTMTAIEIRPHRWAWKVIRFEITNLAPIFRQTCGPVQRELFTFRRLAQPRFRNSSPHQIVLNS
jgi:hypothetical protein